MKLSKEQNQQIAYFCSFLGGFLKVIKTVDSEGRARFIYEGKSIKV